MESTEPVIEFEDIVEATRLTFNSRLFTFQFAGSFIALATLYSFLFFSLMAIKYSVVLSSFIAVIGLGIGYPLLAMTLLITSTMQREGIPSKFNPFLRTLQPKLVRTLIGAVICVIVSLLLGVPHFVLLLIATIQGGEVLLALFLIPLIVLTLVQMLILFFGLFVLPQLVAFEQGDLVELFQWFKEMMVLRGRVLVVRHCFGLILSILLAMPLWLAVEFCLGAIGTISSAVVVEAQTGEKGVTVQPPAPTEGGPMFPSQLAHFSPVLHKLSPFAGYLIGFAAVFAFTFPLTIGFLSQSASGLLALRAMVPAETYVDYPPVGN